MKYSYLLFITVATSLSFSAVQAQFLNLTLSKSESSTIYNFNDRKRIYQYFNVKDCKRSTPNLIVDKNHSWIVHMSRECDTLAKRFEIYEYGRVLTHEQCNNKKGGDLHYKLREGNNKYYKHAPSFVTKTLDEHTAIKLDWYTPFSPDDYSVSFDSGNHAIIGCKADTIWTCTSVYSAGGVTTEGFVYHIEGREVDYIYSKSKAIFRAALVVDPSQIDAWVEKLCELESDWIETDVDKCSYTIPVASSLRIDAESYQALRGMAIAEQKRVLFEDRDSLIATAYSKEWKSKAISDFQKRLKPNLEDGKSLSDLSVEIGLKHFITKVTVYYKDGTTRDFIHYNEWELSSI